MKRVHGPSLLFGFGLGLLITALLGVVFFSMAETRMTDEEIMERAVTLGMSLPSSGEAFPLQEDGTRTLTLSGEETVSQLAVRLERAGLIDSPLELEILARQTELADPPVKGTYTLPEACSVRELVRILQTGPGGNP